MAVASAVPQVEQSIAPLSSGTSGASAAPAGKRVTKQRWISIWTVLLFIIAILANLAMMAIMANRGNPALTATTRPPVVTLSAPAAPSALPSALATTAGEGRFVVGTDIAPGTYRTSGKSGHVDCYWERLKDTSGTTDSIIANNLEPGPATVTINKSDGAFQTRWCSPWTKVS
jgi:hypothetical protein